LDDEKKKKTAIMKYAFIIAFCVMCAAQWLAPLTMIEESESILARGKPYKFRTVPIDPTDPFRGSYLTLRFKETNVRQKTNEKWVEGETMYVIVKQGADGFAQIQEGTLARPSENNDYFKARLSYRSLGDSFNIELPFERFYLEESKASEAEKTYWENSKNNSCYAVVYIKDGNTALKDVMINDKSIVEIVKGLRKK
jgi:uncharacterized membrane-anchored protein